MGDCIFGGLSTLNSSCRIARKIAFFPGGLHQLRAVRARPILLCILFTAACTGAPRPTLEILNSSESIERVMKSDAWEPAAKEIPSFGFARHSVWARSRIENSSTNPASMVLEIGAPWLDQIEFFVEGRPAGRAGNNAVFAADAVYHRHPSFEFSVEPGRTRTIYVHVIHSGLLSLPMRLWDRADFEKKAQGEYIIHGIYFGAIAALLLYNLTLFFIVRDRSYLYYCLYLVCVLAAYSLLGGFARQFFFPSSPWVVKPGTLVVNFLGLAAVLVFSRQFLTLSAVHKLLDRWVLVLAGVCGIGVLSAAFLPYDTASMIGNATTPVIGLTMLASAGLASYKGVRQSRIFLSAWLAVVLGAFLEAVSKFGLLPFTTAGRFGIQIGTLVEVVLFSVALGRRIRTLAEEKARSEDRLRTLEKDLELARSIQRRILPSRLPEIENVDLSVHYQPLHMVGGDFYDFHVKDKRRIGILIADVTGHGVGAALDSSTVKIAFRNEAASAAKPDTLLAGMNGFLTGTLDYRFVSAVYAFVDLEAMKLTYASAGHPPILLLRGNDLVVLETEGLLLGFQSDAAYSSASADLRPGDRLLFYTDGLYDQVQPDDMPVETLHRELVRRRSEPSSSFAASVVRSMQRKHPFTMDDITLLTMTVKA